jgi:hypothetical protein
MSSNLLAFPDHLTGRPVSLALVIDGKLQPPAQLRAQIKRPLELMKASAWYFARQSPSIKRHRDAEEPPPPLGYMLAEFSPCVPVRVMCGCVAFACRRVVTAPAGMRMIYRTTGRWAGWIIERVTRGRVRRVQQTLAAFDAAAAARVAHGPDIVKSAENENSVSVLCHLIADADAVNKRDRNECTPLHYSAAYGHLEVCRLLLQCNADVEAKRTNYNPNTPLHESADKGHLEVCRLLLQCNADVDAKSFNQWTALHLSAEQGHLEVCRLLVESKADVAARTRVGKTALKYAGNSDVAAYLRSVISRNV